MLWAIDLPPALPDDAVLAVARDEDRIVLTNDLDFGELVYRRALSSAGIILLRFRARSSAELVTLFTTYWPEIAPRAPGHFIVASNTRLRIRPLA